MRQTLYLMPFLVFLEIDRMTAFKNDATNAIFDILA